MAAISQMTFSNAFLQMQYFIRISLKFVAKGLIDTKSALV